MDEQTTALIELHCYAQQQRHLDQLGSQPLVCLVRLLYKTKCQYDPF